MGGLESAYDAIEIMSARALSILLIIAGIVLAILLFPELYHEGLGKKDIVIEILVIFLPYLTLKVLTLLLAAWIEISASTHHDYQRQYGMGVEKAKARLFRILYEKKARYYFLSNTALGIERALLIPIQEILANTSKWNGMPIVIITKRPFMVIHIRHRWEKERDLVEIQIAAEDPPARILAKVITSSLEALSREQKE
ncbi:hypothetical protein KJ765_03470 [Candidatus Micrarchaeota archaeon]|nr:hypothetical protein [Candidatus Micrarchaeota archaeon]